MKEETGRDSSYIKFLGTAGARFVVARQLRYSAGVFINIHGRNIILDPGPGTLLRAAKSRPPIDLERLDAIILSHKHIDHSNDINILIDAMTEGGLKRRGKVFAPGECIDGEDAVILRYLRGYPEQIVELKEANEYKIDENLVFRTSISHQHGAQTYGIKFTFAGKVISFLVDTRFFPQLIDAYRDSDLLVINLVRYKPHSSADVMHLTAQDAERIIASIGPKTTILTHFGLSMLRAGPLKVAEELSKKTGTKVIAANDGMSFELSNI